MKTENSYIWRYYTGQHLRKLLRTVAFSFLLYSEAGVALSIFATKDLP